MTILDEKLSAEADYWGLTEEWTAHIPETPLWVDMRWGEYIPYPRHYLPAMASSFDPFTYRRLLGKAYTMLFEYVRRAGNRILEIGCGSGFMSLEMARIGKCVFAFDLSEKRIQLAKGYYEQRLGEEDMAGAVQYFVGNAEMGGIKENRFDAVVCHGSLHHLIHLHSVLDHINQVLKPGGCLIAFEHQGLDKPVESLFIHLDPYISRVRGKERLCRLLDFIFRKAKQHVDHPELQAGGSPLEGISSHHMEEALEQSPMTCIIKKRITPFAFHFVERYATIYDWRSFFKIPALFLLKLADMFMGMNGFQGELILWVGEKRTGTQRGR